MLNRAIENHKRLIKYSRYYFIVCSIVFLIFGGAGLENITDRLTVSFGILIGYLMFFNFTGLYLRMVKKANKYNWDKAKKVMKFQLNFFFFFGCVGMLMIILSSLANPREIPFMLMASNVVIGIVTGTLKSKFEFVHMNIEF